MVETTTNNQKENKGMTLLRNNVIAHQEAKIQKAGVCLQTIREQIEANS